MKITDEFPKGLPSFIQRFGSEEACRKYLSEIKWPDGFSCPNCGCKTYWNHAKKDLWICTKCEHQTSLRAGTVFEHSKKPLTIWFFAIFHITNSKQGISALELQRLMEFGSYKTAWTWLHKLRQFMAPTEKSPKLKAEVEVDDLTIGGKLEGGKPGRGSENKAKLMIALERRGRRSGRVRVEVVEAHNTSEMCAFTRKYVEPGATLYIDGTEFLNPLASEGYVLHSVTTNINGRPIKGRQGKKLAELQLPKAHRVITKIKLLFGGTHQNSWSAKHLNNYLGEYCYRFDRRDSDTPGRMFQELTNILSTCKPKRYWQIIGRPNYWTPLKEKTSLPFWTLLKQALDIERGIV
jgi:ribosomal protein L37AE/L43A